MTAPTLRVCSFESRRSDEMRRLIEKSGGVPTIAPSMREVPLTESRDVIHFAEELNAGRLDAVVFMTGVGTTALFEALASHDLLIRTKSQLANCKIIARGPKPAAVLSREQIQVDLKAPEPNTWREIAAEMEHLNFPFSGCRIAIQEYGVLNDAFHKWLQTRGARVIPVSIYRWALPEDTSALRSAIQHTIAGDFDVLLWTSAQQIEHVLLIAEQMNLRQEWLAAANRCVVGSIGPTASERATLLGLPADLEPSHPKMAHLVRETISAAADILPRKCALD